MNNQTIKPDLFSGGGNYTSSYSMFNNQNSMKNNMGGSDMQTEDHYNNMGLINGNQGFNDGNRGQGGGIGMGQMFPVIGVDSHVRGGGVGGAMMGNNPMFSNSSNNMFPVNNHNNNIPNSNLFNNPSNNQSGFPSIFNDNRSNNSLQSNNTASSPSMFNNASNIFNNPNEFSGASSLFNKPNPQDLFKKPAHTIAPTITQQPTGSLFAAPPPGNNQAAAHRPAAIAGNDVAGRLIKKINGPKNTARLNN
jgi:hypothetical protein